MWKGKNSNNTDPGNYYSNKNITGLPPCKTPLYDDLDDAGDEEDLGNEMESRCAILSTRLWPGDVLQSAYNPGYGWGNLSFKGHNEDTGSIYYNYFSQSNASSNNPKHDFMYAGWTDYSSAATASIGDRLAEGEWAKCKIDIDCLTHDRCLEMKATKAWWEDEGNFELQEHKEQMYTTLNQYQQIFKTRRYEVDGQGQLEDEEPLTRDELEEKHFPSSQRVIRKHLRL